MKYLVSTEETQGQRANDFCFVPEGEQVHTAFACSSGSTDDHCGCRRSLGGVDACRGTTTMKVAEAPIDVVLAGLRRAYINEGWYIPGAQKISDVFDDATGTLPEGVDAKLLSCYGDDEMDEKVLKEAKSLAHALSAFPVGQVCEYRHGRVSPRAIHDCATCPPLVHLA